MSGKLNRARHQVNVVGCGATLLLCAWIVVALLPAAMTLPPPVPNDPDAGKAEGIYWFGIAFSGLLGVASLVSLIRSVRTLRTPADRLDK